MENQMSKEMCAALRKMANSRYNMELLVMTTSGESNEAQNTSCEDIYEGLRESICSGEQNITNLYIFYMLGNDQDLVDRIIVKFINDQESDWGDMLTEDFHGNQKPIEL